MQICLKSVSENSKTKYPFVIEQAEKHDAYKNYTHYANFNETLRAYLANSCFDHNIKSTNAFKRPLNKNDLSNIDFSTPITAEEIFTNKNLIINKVLLSIYEQDLLFIDSVGFKDDNARNDFKIFYDPNLVALGKALKPHLEYLAFNFLKKEIEVIGNWDKDIFHNYLENIINNKSSNDCSLTKEITSSDNPEVAAKIMLIQL